MPDSKKDAVTRLNAVIDAAEEDSYGSESDSQLANDRAYAINLYLGKNVDPVMEGRSSAVDRAVFETVEWIKPSLCRIFANGEDVVELPPLGPDDEAAAKQEAQYLNHVITQKNNWFEIFLNWISDALVTKNAYCLAYKDTLIDTTVERYERQTENGLAMLLQDSDVEVMGQKSYPDPDYQPQPMMQQTPMGPQPVVDPATGQPAMQPPPMLYDVQLRRKSEKGRVCIKVLAPERCKISERTPSWRLQECDYFEYWDWKTISDLRAEGFDVEDDIPNGEDPDAPEDQARDQFSESRDGENVLDPSMRRVKARSIWIRYDLDGDGIAEMLYVVRVGKEILYQEEVGRIPVACIVTTPLPHRHIGMSIADITADLQRINTAILRQGIDNLFLSNNTRHAITSKVNLDDMLMNRPGGVVQIEDGGIPANEIMPLVTPFVFPQAMEALGYMDHVREKRTGVNNSFQGLDANQLSQLQPGTVNQISTMAAQRVELVARIIATGVEDLFSIVHELILKSGHQKEVVKLRGQWTEVDPATWKKRNDFRIAVGYAAGNKDALVSKLLMIGNFMKEAAMGGLSIVQPNNFYELGMELVKASDLTSPARFLTNPEEAPEKQPPQPDPTIMAVEQLKSQTALQTKDMDVQQKERDSQRDYDVNIRKMATDAEIAIKTHTETLQHQRETTEFGARKDAHMAQLGAQLNPKNIEAESKAKESATASEVLKAMQQSNEQQTQVIIAAFQELTKAMSAPREFVRDPKTGKATGSRIAANA
jgi:hypothetical protein